MDPTAVMGRRIGAWVIDFVIAFVIFIIALLAFGDSFETGFNPCGIDGGPTLCFYVNDTTYLADGGDATAVNLVVLGSGLLFAWILQGATGGTPGKLMVGLRVIDQNTGQLAGYGKSLGRTLMWVVDGIPFIVPLVGLITGLASKGHRRVGDMAAKTLVVDKGQVGIPPVIAGLTAPAATGYAAASPVGYGAPPPPGVAMPTASPAADGISGPKWDADRNAYIQWHAEVGQWLQYDDATAQWLPISQ